MFRRKREKKTFDRTAKKPVIRSSICTGEKVAGFKDLRTGNFEEVMVIRGRKDLEDFMKTYGIAGEEIPTEY